jgi:redox-sensitive bicupin YhaK (pirin superfamily)
VLEPRTHDLGGGLLVERLLPGGALRFVGPFVFLDRIGPATLQPPSALDVRPHPHIGLATVTYLLEGEILHRDSLGSAQAIQPGAVNWMTAGRGIVHSERTPPALRGGPQIIHGAQLWVGLPAAHAEAAPAFRHHPAASLPHLTEGAVSIRLLAGDAFGAASPARSVTPLFLADVRLPDGARLPLPPAVGAAGHAERGACVLAGALEAGGHRVGPGRLAVLPGGGPAPALTAVGDTRVLLLGGAPLGERLHMWWNFVAPTKERIEEAKAAWREGRFPRVPGDEAEFVPLPER